MADQAGSGAAPRILFSPVSGPGGVGEYMRSLTIARAVRNRWPRADVRFIVSREAPYASDVQFGAFLVAKSPTKQVREVNRIVSEFRPQIMIFDCSGRAAQLRHATRLGCRTVFVSQHRRKRRRGFKGYRMWFTDLHWIVQPSFVDGELGLRERVKLKLLGRPRVSFIGPVYPPAEPPALDLPSPPYFFCCAGGGRTPVKGRNSAELFASEAARVAQSLRTPGVMVMGPSYGGNVDSLPGLVVVPKLDGPEITHVLGAAEFAMLAGGDMLGQAVALGIPSVAAAIGPDQPSRIRAYAREGLCVEADPTELARVTLERLTADVRMRLRGRLRAAGLSNGLDEAVRQIAELLERDGASVPERNACTPPAS